MDNLTKVFVVPEPLGRPADVLLKPGASQALDYRYSFFLETEGLVTKAGDIEVEAEKKNIAAWTEDTQIRLKKLMEEITSATPIQFNAYLMHLKQIGVRYYQMIPLNVREYIKALPADPVHTLYIYAPYHWIPWELIFDGKDFWGDKCVVSRIPILDFDANQATRTVIASGPCQITAVLNVVGNDIQNNLAEADRPSLTLDSLCSHVQTDCNLQNGHWARMNIAEVQDKIGKVNIVHFTCHGRFDDEFGYYLQLDADDQQRHSYRLYNSLLRGQFSLNGALVFVNACTSDVPSLQLGSFTNLGQEFFESGADVFIGTLAPVPLQRAVRLAADFYERLLQGDGTGIALHKAKSAMKQTGNPFWLFYCLYGNALKRFTL